MVLGNGMLAKRFSAFQNDKNFIIFASGVSNSGNKSEPEFDRERLLLIDAIEKNSQKQLVYFSTCSIYDASLATSPYVQHKLGMEQLIRESAPNYTIFRVSNPVGITNNQHTVLNYFIHHITQEKPFEIWVKAGRNLIDIDDMYTICKEVLQTFPNKNTVNIANPKNYGVIDIISAVEQHFNIKGVYTLAEKGSSPQINITSIEPIIIRNNIHFDNNYLQKILFKYYPRL